MEFQRPGGLDVHQPHRNYSLAFAGRSLHLVGDVNRGIGIVRQQQESRGCCFNRVDDGLSVIRSGRDVAWGNPAADSPVFEESAKAEGEILVGRGVAQENIFRQAVRISPERRYWGNRQRPAAGERIWFVHGRICLACLGIAATGDLGPDEDGRSCPAILSEVMQRVQHFLATLTENVGQPEAQGSAHAAEDQSISSPRTARRASCSLLLSSLPPSP